MNSSELLRTLECLFGFLTIEDLNDMLSRNDEKEIPLNDKKYPRRAEISASIYFQYKISKCGHLEISIRRPVQIISVP